jgi:hypothetical protein
MPDCCRKNQIRPAQVEIIEVKLANSRAVSNLSSEKSPGGHTREGRRVTEGIDWLVPVSALRHNQEDFWSGASLSQRSMWQPSYGFWGTTCKTHGYVLNNG